LEKEKLYPQNQSIDSFRMSDSVLENYIHQYITQQDSPEITFAWQGGEPTLMGIDFFQRALNLQSQHRPPDKTIHNCIQTNGTLLDDAWCDFLHRHDFLVGLSIDGPKEIHDTYRVNKGGHGTFDSVLRGWELLEKHSVKYNTLTVVNRLSGDHPMEVYNFLKSHGSRFMQFIPLVERAGPDTKTLASPPLLRILNQESPVAPWSVQPLQYGRFMSTIFDHWVRHDVGQIFVQLFDVQLGIELGVGSSLCVFSETCGRALAIEHNGDLYSCDHFVYPDYKLGNIATQTMEQMVDSPQQHRFGQDKRDALPNYCQRCEVRQHCNGECPKHRFLTTPDGDPGLNYLCAGYKHLFAKMKPHLQTMAALLRQDRAPSEIMTLLTQPQPRPATAGRNAPCPCGSGKKYKKCCGAN
jgi:uncharacterized protein